MRMGTVLWVEHERSCEMAAERASVGIDHLTVVPETSADDPEAGADDPDCEC